MYTNSALATYTNLSPNVNKPGRIEISKITIHHAAVVGATAKNICDSLARPERRASANYCIGNDGSIAMNAEEKDRAWTSSSAWNDCRAITIEVANQTGDPDWLISKKAMESLIALCTDICQRNGFRLNYTGDKNGSLTMHKWYAATACPGPYLSGLFPYIAEAVNRRLDEAEKAKDEEVIDMTMTKEELLQLIDYTVSKKLMGKGTEVPKWAIETWEKGIEDGLTDGQRPEGYAKRDEVVAMIERAMK